MGVRRQAVAAHHYQPAHGHVALQPDCARLAVVRQASRKGETMTDNDEVPNSERSPGAARMAAALILIYVAATLAGVLAATT